MIYTVIATTQDAIKVTDEDEIMAMPSTWLQLAMFEPAERVKLVVGAHIKCVNKTMAVL